MSLIFSGFADIVVAGGGFAGYMAATKAETGDEKRNEQA
jgi:succinate dehydrogenase/fumarate reductase flavoprotein subunit